MSSEKPTSNAPEMVKLTIDGQEVEAPKGMNLIDASKLVDVEVPYYCYHPDLSVAGNCRMCQVEVEGMRKLTIGCNTTVAEGMVVKTQKTSAKVADAQRATLEFLLINHPLDCTVCDQAGHCKLQDYYYDYNGKPSRFVEEKVKSVKAEPFGPGVVYDGERCIVCTRCVRFCDEVTETGELGLYNRGDKAVIGIHPTQELDNPLSGNVVDLCPVGALTHRQWRFNSRIWYTKESSSVCVGCSTGCNVSVCTRDEEFVQVKGRYNKEVTGEWLCDEGRYGFDRFQPKTRLTSALVRNSENYLEEFDKESALNICSSLFKDKSSAAAVFLSPLLTLEEMWLANKFAMEVMGVSSNNIAVRCKTRELSDVEKIVVSPDYAPNAKSAYLLGLVDDSPKWRDTLESSYSSLLDRVRSGKINRVLLVGDFAIDSNDIDEALVGGILEAEASVSLGSFGVVSNTKDVEEQVGAQQLCKVLLPIHSVYEKSGVMLNKDSRIQRVRQVMPDLETSSSAAELFQAMAKRAGRSVLSSETFTSRAVFKEMVKDISELSGLTLKGIGDGGVGVGSSNSDVSASSGSIEERV